MSERLEAAPAATAWQFEGLPQWHGDGVLYLVVVRKGDGPEPARFSAGAFQLVEEIALAGSAYYEPGMPEPEAERIKKVYAWAMVVGP